MNGRTQEAEACRRGACTDLSARAGVPGLAHARPGRTRIADRTARPVPAGARERRVPFGTRGNGSPWHRAAARAGRLPGAAGSRLDRHARTRQLHLEGQTRDQLPIGERAKRRAWCSAVEGIHAMATARPYAAVCQKNTVAVLHTLGSCHGYRGPSRRHEKGLHGSCHGYRRDIFQTFTVAKTATQILIPTQGVLIRGEKHSLQTRTALVGSEVQS